MLYESGLSMLQLRVLLLLWAASLAKACSMEANPFETFLVLGVALSPLFEMLDEGMKTNTERRAKRDEAQLIEMQEIIQRGEVLPVSFGGASKKTKNEFKRAQYVPVLWTSITSILFMCYLLTRRH